MHRRKGAIQDSSRAHSQPRKHAEQQNVLREPAVEQAQLTRGVHGLDPVPQSKIPFQYTPEGVEILRLTDLKPDSPRLLDTAPPTFLQRDRICQVNYRKYIPPEKLR